MSVHESDVATNEKLIELQKMEQILKGYDRKIREYQRCIHSLSMVSSTKTNDDGISEIIYTLPNNFARNEIDSDYREAQQKDLIVNIDKLLVELEGFLK